MSIGGTRVVSILVADDHDLVRTGIVRMLSDVEDFNVIGEVATGEEAITFCRQNTPDVILMDVRMPGIGGLEATRKLQHCSPSSKIIAVTVYSDDPYPSRLLEAGASGYLTKGAALDEMVTAIRAVVSGSRYISPDIAQQMALKPFSKKSDNPFEQLSQRELQIATMIVQCQKVQDISDKLCLSPKTVNSYRYRIFDKLDINSDVELTHLAIRHALVDTQTMAI